MKNYISKFQKILLIFLFTPLMVFAAGLVPSCGVECDFGDFIQLIQNVINFLIFDMAMPLAAAVFAWAGVLMLTAGGSMDKIKQAKEVFWWVLVGIMIALAGWLIVSTIMGALLGDNIAEFIKDNFLDF